MYHPEEVLSFLGRYHPRVVVREGIQYMYDDDRMRGMRHRFGDYLRKSSVQVKDYEGSLLLIQGTVTEEWGTPGGNAEQGETFEDAARREVREETGLDVDLLRAPAMIIWTAGSPNAGTTRVYHAIFVGRVVEGAVRPQLEEVLAVRFLTRPEVAKLVNKGKAGEYLLEQWDW